MNKYLWAAIGLAVTLVLAVSVLASPLAGLPASQAGSAGIYVQYDNVNHNIDPAHGYLVAGGQNRWGWNDLEPVEDTYAFNSKVKTFVLGEAEHGKKAAIGFETYVRSVYGDPPYGGIQTLPEWLWYNPVILMNTRDNQYYVVNFLDATYKAKYADFVYDFAAWLAAPENAAVLANLSWIEMGVGMDSETQPGDPWAADAQVVSDALYYINNAPGGSNPPGWTSGDWTGFVNWCTDLYYDAFRVRNPSLASVSLYLNCAPEFKGKDNISNRTAFTDYAATRGVADGKPGIGLKNNGLDSDRSPAGLYAPLEKWGSTVAGVTVPIAWETYQDRLSSLTKLYWGVLCALDKHPDVIEPIRWLLVDGSYNPRTDYVAVWNWAAPYLGVTPATTPGIWCALRQTETGGEPGNFFFWLYQNDSLSGGKTVALYSVTAAKEGRYARRTDRANSNPYMHFQVLNTSPFRGNASGETYTVTVTYLDKGTDQWKLRYDSTTGTKDAGTVVKTNTNTWKQAVFVLTDARFAYGYTDNGSGGGTGGAAADLTVDSMDSGDETIHMVHIARGVGGGSPTPTLTPTPTPTATPVASTLRGRVWLQGRPAAPNAQWVVSLTVTVGGSGYGATTDTSGYFTITNLTPGTYCMCVKGAHTLARCKTGVTLVAGFNAVDFGSPQSEDALREGDADSDDVITIKDFSIMATAFGSIPVSDPRADFNQDGYVNISDFSLLATNFNGQGDVFKQVCGS